MGCDIHMTVERRTKSGWVCINTMLPHEAPRSMARPDGWRYSYPAALERDYQRFAALAGVRGDGPEPRGIPDDASETTKYLVDYWGVDGHSHSWLPIQEAAAIMLSTDGGEATEYQKKYPAGFYFGVDDSDLDKYRLVFWFDN